MLSEGLGFLHKQDTKLHSSKPVEKNYQRLKRKRQAIPNQPEDKIAAFHKVIEKTHFSHLGANSERDHNAFKKLKDYYHKKYLIKKGNIPESYYEHRLNILIKEGRKKPFFTLKEKEEIAEQVIASQKRSLNKWINYFCSEESATYPMWAKHWAFKELTHLGAFNQKSQTFNKRTQTTTAGFLELNKEVVAKLFSFVNRKIHGKNIGFNDDKLKLLLEKINFADLYLYIQKSIVSEEKRDLRVTEGKWVDFLQGSDPKLLVEKIDGHGTNWCIADEDTAEDHLRRAGLSIYFSNDKNGDPRIPRVAIRMLGREITELRGIAEEQNLDPLIDEEVDKKLNEFPDAEIYKQMLANQRQLNEVYKKYETQQELDCDDLVFIYEIDQNISIFGQGFNPRVDEILNQRSREEDMVKIFTHSLKCKESQIAFCKEELNDEILVYVIPEQGHSSEQNLPSSLKVIVGSLALTDQREGFKLPASLIKVTGSLNVSYTKIKKLPSRLRYIGGDLNIENTGIKTLAPGLKVGGSYFLENSAIENLSDDISYISGALDLTNTPIESLPSSLKAVRGSLLIGDTKIGELPETLKLIHGSLVVANSSLKKLPANLQVMGRDFDISNTAIAELPEKFGFQGLNFSISESQIKTLPEDLLVPKAHIDLSNTELTKLPDSWTHIPETLDISGTNIDSLTKLVDIGGNLVIYGIDSLTLNPELAINGVIYASHGDYQSVDDFLDLRPATVDYSDTGLAISDDLMDEYIDIEPGDDDLVGVEPEEDDLHELEPAADDLLEIDAEFEEDPDFW